MSYFKFEIEDRDNGNCVYEQHLPDETTYGVSRTFKRDELMAAFRRFLETVGYVFPEENDLDDFKVYTTGFDPN